MIVVDLKTGHMCLGCKEKDDMKQNVLTSLGEL